MENIDFYAQKYAHLNPRDMIWRDLTGKAKAENIQKITTGLPVQTILDIGSGTGAVLAQLAKFGFGQEYTALDIAETAISIIQERGDISGLVEAKVFDGLHIPYADDCFDLAVLSHVIEHLNDPRPLLREAARAARYVAIEVPLEDNLYTHIKVGLLKSNYRQEIGHVQWYNPRSFRAMLETGCGFQVLRQEIVYVPDELYHFRHGEQNLRRKMTGLSLSIRKALRSFSSDLYIRLFTDHCIALGTMQK